MSYSGALVAGDPGAHRRVRFRRASARAFPGDRRGAAATLASPFVPTMGRLA